MAVFSGKLTSYLCELLRDRKESLEVLSVSLIGEMILNLDSIGSISQ